MGSLHLLSAFILIILFSYPIHGFSQIYQWTDEKGVIHFTEDPSTIPEQYLSNINKSKETISKSPLERVPRTDDDLKSLVDQKSNGVLEALRDLKIHKEKSINDLFYLIGLLIILAFIIKILIEIKPAGINEKINLKRPSIFPKKTVLFNVYYRDYTTQSMVFLGKIIERRRRERGNNSKDLLFKAKKDYGDRVRDPSSIFLLSS
jgi:hypothetical protein